MELILVETEDGRPLTRAQALELREIGIKLSKFFRDDDVPAKSRYVPPTTTPILKSSEPKSIRLEPASLPGIFEED